MEQFEIIVPTLFGLETFTAKEVRRLGYETTSVEDGRVTFLGDWAAVCRANMWIRTGERVLIKAAEFKALSFEELFDKTYEVDWERWIGKSYEFPVKGYSLKSKLASVPDCQSIIKGAIAKKLSSVYGVERMPEDGALSRVQFSILKDRVTIMVDTSGEGLHKRGYRQNSNLAPLRETIAAAMVMMSYWKWEYPFCDKTISRLIRHKLQNPLISRLFHMSDPQGLIFLHFCKLWHFGYGAKLNELYIIERTKSGFVHFCVRLEMYLNMWVELTELLLNKEVTYAEKVNLNIVF